MPDEELARVTERAISDTEGMVLFLDDYCEMLTEPSEEQKTGLRQMTQLDPTLVEMVLNGNINDQQQWETICEAAKCLKRQAENYLYPVLDVMYAKQEQGKEAETKSGYSKVLSRIAVSERRK